MRVLLDTSFLYDLMESYGEFPESIRGFLDATPIRRGMLVDFVLVGQSLIRALELADLFWTENPPETRNAQRFEAAVHALLPEVSRGVSPPRTYSPARRNQAAT